MFLFCSQDNDRTPPRPIAAGTVDPTPRGGRRNRPTKRDEEESQRAQAHVHTQYIDLNARATASMLTPRHRHHYTTHDRTYRRSNPSEQMRGPKKKGRALGRRHADHDPVCAAPDPAGGARAGPSAGGTAAVPAGQRQRQQLRRSHTQYHLHAPQAGQHERLSRAARAFTIPPFDTRPGTHTAPINIPRFRDCGNLATDLVCTDDDLKHYGNKTEHSSWRMYARMSNSGMRVPSPSEADQKAARDRASSTPDDVGDDGIFEIDV